MSEHRTVCSEWSFATESSETICQIIGGYSWVGVPQLFDSTLKYHSKLTQKHKFRPTNMIHCHMNGLSGHYSLRFVRAIMLDNIQKKKVNNNYRWVIRQYWEWFFFMTMTMFEVRSSEMLDTNIALDCVLVVVTIIHIS